MSLLNTLRKIRACEGEAAAQVVFEHYLMLERNKVLDAAWPDIKIMQQALLEINHAQREGPDWYTKGESGLYQQVRMWLDRGLKASAAIQRLKVGK